MKISVIGLGYVGLPTATMLADKGYKVFGFDTDLKLIKNLKKKIVNINEINFKKKYNKVLDNKKLKVSNKLFVSDIYIIAVPTPINNKNRPDISYVKKAFNSLFKILKKNDLIIVESTCPVGSTESFTNFLQKKRTDLLFKYDKKKGEPNINIAYCPERVLPGNIFSELINNNRIIGVENNSTFKKVKKVYKSFVKGKLTQTSVKLAEFSKLAENSYRDVNIAFSNEISILSDKLNINVWELIKLTNMHPRVNILNPGPGVGGHCIPVDPWFIISDLKNNAKLISTARKVNLDKEKFVVKKIEKFITKNKKNIHNISISFFGLSYKPDVFDFRESPSIKIINDISKYKFKNIYTVEPLLKNTRLNINKKIKNVKVDYALKNSDVLVFLVKHSLFKSIKTKKLNNYIVYDFINLLK